LFFTVFKVVVLFMAYCIKVYKNSRLHVTGGKVTIPLLVREVLKIEASDYARLNINQVIRKK